MPKIIKKSSGGGIIAFVISIIASILLTFSMPFLGASPLIGILAWPILYWAAKKDIKEDMEANFPEAYHDEIANELFDKGEDNVTVIHKKWSDAPIPLPEKLIIKYKKKPY